MRDSSTETTPAAAGDPVTRARALVGALNEVIYDKPELVRMLVASFLAGGHALLEGLPGLGKTVLARSFAAMTGLVAKRIQFTPDLMPADITGTHILEDGPSGKQLRFVPGPVFCNFLLADEINRASPRTQAALLEAMAEGRVTSLGETRALGAPFFVVATQNPIELEGTNPLPEAQVDRFAVKIDVPATAEETLLRIVRSRPDGNPPPPAQLLDREALLAAQAAVDRVFLPEAVARFVARLVARTAPDGPAASEAVRRHVRYGSSPRGAIWLSRLARALALLAGRESAGFEDVGEAAPFVLAHRLILNAGARLERVSARALVVDEAAATLRDLLST